MRFLLVEADRDRVLLRYMLEQVDHLFEEAGTIQEAQRLLVQAEPYDAILMGLHLPNGAGEEAFLRLHRATDGVVPIVLLSDRRQDTEAEIRRLIALGAAGYVWRGETSSRQILAELYSASEHAKHSARLTTDESLVAEASTRAVGELRKASTSPTRESDFPAALAEAHRTQNLTQRQMLAALAALRDEQRDLQAEVKRLRRSDRRQEEQLGEFGETLDTAEIDMRRARRQLAAVEELIDQHQQELAKAKVDADRRIAELEAAAARDVRVAALKTFGVSAPVAGLAGFAIKFLIELFGG